MAASWVFLYLITQKTAFQLEFAQLMQYFLHENRLYDRECVL